MTPSDFVELIASDNLAEMAAAMLAEIDMTSEPKPVNDEPKTEEGKTDEL